MHNRAAIRLVLACALAKAQHPESDARQPYTQIGGTASFSGRTLDESFIGPFITQHQLPCNATTAFLTPALRNRNQILTPDLNLVGRPPAVYKNALGLLTALQDGLVSATNLLAEAFRLLILMRDEAKQRRATQLASLAATTGTLPLAAEPIITLIEQHLRLPHTSRLPVLLVTAAYEAAGALWGEQVKPLNAHNAADSQTGAVGDVEIITAANDAQVTTGFEMKMKSVTREDIDAALPKLVGRGVKHYVFITTSPVEAEIKAYAETCYELLSGIEIVVLDCVSFVRYFLHLFHSRRADFLEHYQRLLLAEPSSAVRQVLKEAWLAMRLAAESRLAEPEE